MQKKKMNLINKAKELFFHNTKYRQEDIADIKQIHNGYVNISFLFILKNQVKYQIRLSSGVKLVNRKAEYEILKLTKNEDFIYYDKKTGNAIKKWIDGSHPNKKEILKRKFIKNLVGEIKKLHNIKITSTSIPKIDYGLYNKNIDKLDSNIKSCYLKLLDKYQNLPLVINHSDINSQNLIVDKKFNVHLIDWEWTTLNNDYWDYANFIREEYIPINKIKLFTRYNKKLDINILQDHIFICCTFALLWTHAMDQTDKIKQYNQKLIKQVNMYCNHFYKDKM